MLYYFAEKSIPEIASLLEVPEGTVKFRLHQGRKKAERGTTPYDERGKETGGRKKYLGKY